MRSCGRATRRRWRVAAAIMGFSGVVLYSAVMWAWDGAAVLPKTEQARLDQEMDVVHLPKANRKSSPGLDQDTWPTLAQRIEAAGLSPKQVQACWLKHVEANPKPLGEFPAHARALQADLTAILNIARHHYPNLRVAYLSSRTFGGWSGRASGSPEPYAYESGFGTRWVVQSQIRGDAQLNCDPARGEVKAPLVLWGPYLWARGNLPRKLDGLVWTESDVRADRLHPNEAGSQKITTLLLNFFKTNEGASRWFLKPGEKAQRPLPKAEWLDLDRGAPNGTQYKTFQSKVLGREVSYLVYLPPAIVVLVNGMVKSFYCDSSDGQCPMESVIIHLAY